MSGFEIAGITLAVFPIVVQGLTTFVEGVETIKLWRRYRRELADYKRLLETQHIWYLDTLEELLDGIVYSDKELALLVDIPGGPAWQRPEYDARLRARLDHSYEPYMATIYAMVGALESLKKKLGVDSSGKVTWDSTPGLKREANRLKTVLSKNVYAELLAKIDKANKDLREFTHQNRYLEAVRNKRRVGVHRQRIADFRKIRRSARSLHNVVIGRKSWNCHHPHMVNIRLEPQPWDAAGVDGNKLKFRILLSCMHQAGNVPGAIPVWKWQELEIEPAEAQDVSSNPTTGLLFMSNSQTSQGHNAPSSDIKGSPKSLAANTVKKGVRFAIDNPSTNVPVPISIATLAAPITDMCSAVHSTPCSIRTCIGFLLDDHASSIAHRHDVFVLGDGKSADAQPQSLEKLLASWKQIGRRRPPGTIFFSRRDRIFIAASLASSVLQLDGSWLKKHWRSCDIFFLPKAGSNPDAVHHPYLSWDVPQKDNLDALTSSDPHSPFAVHLIHGEVFFPLGLTLVELSLGQTWADLEKAEEMDSKETMKNLKTALNYVYDESGPRYGDVVRRCLFWPIDFREPTLEDDEFQQSVLETIVMPLIEDWKDFDGSLRIR